QHARTRPVHRNSVNAVTDFCCRIRDVERMQAAVDRLPGLARVVGAERARRRDRDENSIRFAWIENYRVQAHATGARRPRGPRAVAAQTGKLLPRLPAVGRAKQRSVFNARVNRVRIGQRWFEMPDALELPGVRRTVVPLVRGEGFTGFRRRVVNKLVALALGHALRGGGRFAGGCSRLVPCLAAVIGALNDLSKPAARLRCIESIRISGRPLEMVDLPARKEGVTDVPSLALGVRREDERTLACANQYPYSTHNLLLPIIVVFVQIFSKPAPSIYIQSAHRAC